MNGIKWTLTWVGKTRWKLILAIILSALSVCAMAVEPFIFRIIIDDVLGKGEYERLLPLLGLAISAGVSFMLMRYFISILCEQASQHAIYELRGSLFDRILAQTPAFFRENRAGDLITIATGDVDLVRHFIAWVIPKWAEVVLMLTVVLTVFLSISPIYTLCLFVLTPLTAFAAINLAKRIRPAYGAAREQLSKLNTVVQENISGNRVVKAFVREDYETRRFSRENEEYKDRNIQANSIWLKYGPIIESVASLLTIVNLVVGGIMVITEQITLGQLNIFLSLSWALNEPMVLVGYVVNDTQRYMASVEKVMGLYYARNSIKDGDEPVAAERLRGDISFKNVTLRYDGSTILDDISLEIKAGETIGFMGPTGGGKTSLVGLIGRSADVSKGAVLVDGINVEKYSLSSLRRNIASTMQEVFLFSDTVESNIAYGVPDAPMETVVRSAVVADADSFIQKMPEGYDTIVGERGTGLSGGQKQRISLARALAVEAPILILDDTTSAVDMETEKYIQGQLKAMPKSATTLIIAQRVSSLKHADRIYVIDGGRVTEAGSHGQLMAKKGYYYRTCLLQQGGLSGEVSRSGQEPV